MPKLEPARHSSDFTAQTQDIRPDPLHRAATTSAADLPRYLLPLPYRKSIKPADSPATVNSYTTAYSNFPTVTATPIRQQRVNSHTPSALPPLTVRNGYDTYAKDPALDASHTLEANKHHRRRMTHQRNDTHNGIHDAAREPLIARGNEPVSSKKAEAMRRKLRAYEAVLAFKNGCMPDTQQLGGWAQYLLRSSSVLDSRNRRLSSKGREFVRDTRAWVEALVDLLLSKNYDDKIQEFIWHTSHAGVSATVPDVGGAVKAGASGSKGDASKALERLRGLAGLLWSSSEFRALIGDFAAVGRDMFADAAAQVASAASRAEDRARSSDPSNINPEDISRSAVKEKGSAIADSARKATYQFRDDLESYLREKFPKQRRDAVVNRMKKVVQDIQENPDFQETVDFIVELLHKYVTKIKDNVAVEGKTADVKPDEHFDIAMKDIQALLMAFANGKPLDPINDALRKVIDDIQSDKDLKEFYDQVAEEFNRLLTEKGYVISDAADARVHQLYERSQELLHEKQDSYRPDVEHLFAEVRSFIDAIRNDKESQRLVEASKKVYSDLVITDRYGNFRGFRRRIVWDMIEVIFPRFVDEIKFVPVPRIEYQDRDFDLILENVVLESEHFLPTRTILEAFTRLELTNTYTISSSHKTTTHLHIDSINLFVRDASFIIRKKTGLVPFSDRGYIDMFMTHHGASADIVLESVSSDEDDDEELADSYFHVKSVNVTIHNFSYNYHAYHTWAAALLSPIIKPIIRKLVANVLQQRIRSVIEQADREIHAAAERMRVASIANRGGGSVEAWIKAVLSRPQGSGRRRGDAEWRVNVDEPQLFPDEHAPGSVLAKMKRAEERVEREQEEDGWRNSVFDVKA